MFQHFWNLEQHVVHCLKETDDQMLVCVLSVMVLNIILINNFLFHILHPERVMLV